MMGSMDWVQLLGKENLVCFSCIRFYLGHIQPPYLFYCLCPPPVVCPSHLNLYSRSTVDCTSSDGDEGIGNRQDEVGMREGLSGHLISRPQNDDHHAECLSSAHFLLMT
jgi:hypothetical protein